MRYRGIQGSACSTDQTGHQDLQAQATEAVELYSHSAAGRKKAGTRHELYSTILSSTVLDAREKEPDRISQEAFLVLVAGSETTARVLSTGCFHVLDDKKRVMPRLQEELTQVMPDPHTRASIQELEKLPWLVSEDTLIVSSINTRISTC